MYDEAAIDNAAMHQRDVLYDMIDSDEQGQWDLALSFLRFLRESWNVINYHYKGVECCQRLIDRINEALAVDTIHWKVRQRLENTKAAARAVQEGYWADENEFKCPKVA